MHKKQNEEYYYNQHSCFLLQYHLVLITKYRKPAITAVCTRERPLMRFSTAALRSSAAI